MAHIMVVILIILLEIETQTYTFNTYFRDTCMDVNLLKSRCQLLVVILIHYCTNITTKSTTYQKYQN